VRLGSIYIASPNVSNALHGDWKQLSKCISQHGLTSYNFFPQLPNPELRPFSCTPQVGSASTRSCVHAHLPAHSSVRLAILIPCSTSSSYPGCGDIHYWMLAGPSGTRTPPSTSSVFFGGPASLRVTLVHSGLRNINRAYTKRYLFESQELEGVGFLAETSFKYKAISGPPREPYDSSSR
jgi:hypothetical protein